MINGAALVLSECYKKESYWQQINRNYSRINHRLVSS